MGRYGGLAAEINRELKRIADEQELKLIVNGKKRGTVRADLDDKALLLFFQGVTEKFSMELLAMSRNLENEPTEEQIHESEKLMKDMVTLLRQGMGR
jgi:hypothetical protein